MVTELINMYLICTQDKVFDAVVNFVALGVLAQIDNLYAASRTDMKIR